MPSKLTGLMTDVAPAAWAGSSLSSSRMAIDIGKFGARWRAVRQIRIDVSSRPAEIIIARAWDDDAEYLLPAGEVEKIEEQRHQAMARSARMRAVQDRSPSSQPIAETPT